MDTRSIQLVCRVRGRKAGIFENNYPAIDQIDHVSSCLWSKAHSLPDWMWVNNREKEFIVVERAG